MRFTIISTGWRCWPWIRQTLASVDEQTFRGFDVCVADDASGDPELAKFIVDYCGARGWRYLLRDTHLGTLHNQVLAIREMQPDPDDVIVFLDPDGDRLAHPRVLERLADAYADGSQVVYSMYRPEPASPGSQQSRPYPPEVITANSYREFTRTHGHYWNHLRTFAAGLFYEMDDSDFLDEHGRWFQGAPDSALMFPALELARGHVKFLPEVLLIYRADHPLSDWMLHPREIDRAHDTILSRPPKCWWP